MLVLISEVSERSHVRVHVCPFLETENAYPTPLETVLRTEVSLKSILEASGALQCACVVFAIQSGALALLFRRLVHTCKVSGLYLDKKGWLKVVTLPSVQLMRLCRDKAGDFSKVPLAPVNYQPQK